MKAVELNLRIQPGKNEGIAKTFLSYQKLLNKKPKKKFFEQIFVVNSKT